MDLAESTGRKLVGRGDDGKVWHGKSGITSGGPAVSLSSAAHIAVVSEISLLIFNYAGKIKKFQEF